MILNDTQIAVRDSVRAFAQERVRPLAAAAEAEARYPDDLLEEAGRLGLMAMTAPEQWGGAGVDHVSYALALIELAAGDGALSSIVSIQNSLVVSALLADGSEEQKRRFLPDLAQGRLIGAFALTEAEAGSDAAAIRTSACQVAGGWILTGAKQFISSASIAGLAIVVAVTDAAAGRRGISTFLVPTSTPGFIIERQERKLGQHASDTCAIRLENLFVEDELVLGTVGEGYRIALANLETGRIGIAAQSVGMARAALEIAVAYAKERRSFGRPIIEHQAVAFRLSDLATQLEAARQMTLSAAALKDRKQACLVEAAMAKLFASEAAERIVSGALQTLGGYGYLEDYPIAKIYRDVRVCQIYEGTSDIQRMLIARSL